VALALPVRIEFVAAATKKERPKLRRLMAALPMVVPAEDTWPLVESWKARGIDAGYSFSLSALLIAALAHELTGLVWSLDTDFAAMEKLGFVRCY
jgi:predicted nucleic acid-binding protein